VIEMTHSIIRRF